MKDIEKYIYEIYNTRSFSKAASNLFISQPALSNSIKRYEKQLGYEIFDRKSHPVSLTQKGYVYIDYLEEKIALAQQLEESIKRVDSATDKKVRIGSNNSSATFALPLLCKDFSARFPDVNIELSMANNTKTLYDNIEKGALDIILDSKNVQMVERIKLWEEKYVFLIRRDFPKVENILDKALSYDELFSGNFPKEKLMRDLHYLDNVNIFMPLKNSALVNSINAFFERISGRSITIKSFYRMDLQFAMMENGLGAIVCPQSLVISKGYDEEKFCCFSIDIPDNLREMYLYYNKNNLSEYTMKFIKMAEKMYEKKHFSPECSFVENPLVCDQSE